jgi:MerR family transcriptional regulator, light-induced transcriptional regulator
MILEAVDAGVSVKDVYLRVFQPSQREIGRLWQVNKITVAQEHYCTAATQLVMSLLYPRVFAREGNGRRLVATCVAGDLHEIGLRMVADFFEMEGWDTYFLGANVPIASVVAALVDQRADVLAVSATITSHVRDVAALVAAVRANPETANVKVIVGGYPFNLGTNLWRQVGADGSATDAEEAIALANRLTSEETT